MQTKLADTKFMRTYKEEYSVPTSANAKLAIRHGNKKLKTEISVDYGKWTSKQIWRKEEKKKTDDDDDTCHTVSYIKLT